MELVSNQTMRKLDEFAIQKLGIPSLVLMENAARVSLEIIQERSKPNQKIWILAGSGNNGGDGYALARLAIDAGLTVKVVEVLPPKSPDCLIQQKLVLGFGDPLTWEEFIEQPVGLEDLFIDAIFGTGLEREITGPLAEKIKYLNQTANPKIALDMPTGINGSTGDLMAVGIKAVATISFAFCKVGQFLYPGKEYAGEVLLRKISIPAMSPENTDQVTERVTLVDAAFAKSLHQSREHTTYKNQQGHLALLCGSTGMMGAAKLAGLAGLRSGAGLVTLAVPKKEQNVFLEAAPELMTHPREETSSEWMNRFDALAVGCGLGRNPTDWKLYQSWLQEYNGPLLLDADAFYGLEDLSRFDPENLVITPHQGEFLMLSGFAPPKNNTERIQQGYDFIKKHPMTLILKGAPTLVYSSKGQLFINATGNSGMATAGSGDVLTGIVGGLLAQGYSSLDAALLGVYLHGKAGDLFLDQGAKENLIASDLSRGLQAAFLSLSDTDLKDTK